jgi:hypothetical protein
MDEREGIGAEGEPEHPFATLWFLMKIFHGPLLWPIVIANAIVAAWGMYQGWQGFMVFVSFP